MSAVALPEPLCKPYRHPLRWIAQKIQLAASALVFAYLGMLIITALYYLLFEVDPSMTRWWHEAVSNSAIRHDIRDVGEGLLGGLLAQQIIWNHYKRKTQKRLTKKRGLLDRLEIALHIPNVKDGKSLSVGQLVVTPLLVIIYAIPGFFVGIEVAAFLHHHIHHVAVSQPALASPHVASIWTKMVQTFTMNWDKKLIGYFAAFCFGRRPAKGVFDDVQLMFAERRVANKQSLRWYQPAPFKARVNDVRDNYTLTLHSQSAMLKRLVVGALPIAFALAAFGWYVLSYIAK